MTSDAGFLVLKESCVGLEMSRACSIRARDSQDVDRKAISKGSSEGRASSSGQKCSGSWKGGVVLSSPS